MDWLSLWAVAVTVFCLVDIRDVCSIDLHVSVDLGATEHLLLYNASNGVGWSYYIPQSPGRSQFYPDKIITLDSSNGHIHLQREYICNSFSQNPFHFTVVSKSHNHQQTSSFSNYTSVPLTVYLHNVSCAVPSHRKVPKSRQSSDFVYLSLYSNQFSNWNNLQCLENGLVVLKMSQHLPIMLIRSICDISLEGESFLYDKDSGEISMQHIQCGRTVTLVGELQLCDHTRRYPFKISINDISSSPLDFSIANLHSHSHRIRRATYAAPVFNTTQYRASIAENRAAETEVIRITATDSDEGAAGMITYTLVSIRDARSDSMFKIDPISGLVKTTQPLDREVVPVHDFKVTATDSSPYSKSDSAILTITVEDVNDHIPTFAQKVYTVKKTENIPATSIIITVRATDGDAAGPNSNIRYSIIQPPNHSTFKIDPTQGSISTLKVLDRELAANYQLVVQAKDQAPFGKQKSSTATVSIIVLDENDNFPQFSTDSLTVSVSENLDVSTKPIIARISATDADEGRNHDITYSITGGNIDNTFYIDANTGEVAVQHPLNYEANTDFRLKMKASDNGIAAKTNSTTLWVRVKDINDNAPYFQSSEVYRGTVLEDEKTGSSVLTVNALDDDSGDNQILTYSLLNAPSTLPFSINENNGQISVKSTLDREIQGSYSFVVQAKDHGKPRLSSTASVEITVRDTNDNSPVFLQRKFFISVSEDAPLYKEIIQVTANDADIGENALLVYVFISGNNDQIFKISRDTGIITLNKKLDFKTQNRYILTVKATDSGEKYDRAEVHINVTDINKHVPSFDNTPYQMNVDENSKIGVSVGKVQAVDKDVGENGRITYEIVDDVQEFHIDPNSGEITTRENIDRELQTAYSFDIEACDHGMEAFCDTASVIIIINDINDNRPQFSEASHKPGNVSESAFDGTRVLTVHAVDNDLGINSQIKYQFEPGSSGVEDFEIDSASGEIRVAQNSHLDRETRNNYTLTIQAIDSGVIPQSSSIEVYIKIDDINDNAPVFASDEIIAMVSENKKIGSTVAVIEAVDPDEGVNAVVEYSFEGGLDADKFILVNRPGDPAIIVNNIDLDYESEKKVYEINLKAESGNLFSSAIVIIQVQDVNDNQPILKDFTIIFNNFIDHFPSTPIGRVPAFDPDVSDRDKLHYEFVLGNQAGFLHLDNSTGEITLDSRLNSDVPRNGTIQVKVSDGINEVKATCRLFVRLVTEEMLKRSVTIRLNNMTSSAFLSPLYLFFVDALAHILVTDKNNIFVFNVKNDTDVSAQILNVTVSVREKTIVVDRQTVDVFYQAEYLKEQIYLQRTLLANLSTLQVLPFDDNLCLKELCSAAEVCLSELTFGMAAPFISSDTMLFRPVTPNNGYTCDCPKAFTDKTNLTFCDIEVDFCYSNPCGNNGRCLRQEGGYSCSCHGGFAGDNCEIDLSVKYQHNTCPDNVCRPPSRCQPLIEKGFRCEGCPNQVDYNGFCQMTTRSFPPGSFLMYPSLKRRFRFTVQLRFATQQRNGLLFYNGRFNEQHDFIALEIIDGQVQFSFSPGSNVTRVSPYVEGGVSDGKWHQVTVHYLNKTATVTVGEDCDTEISVRYGSAFNYTCAARETLKLHPNCSRPDKICSQFLDMTGPFQIGGLPTLPSHFQTQTTHYIGCMKDFHIDNELLDFNTSVANNGTEIGCANKREYCGNAPCQHGGTCVEGWLTYMCHCPDRWGGKDCSQEIDIARRLNGDGYIHYSNQLITRVHFPWYNGVSFRTHHGTGTLVFIVAEQTELIHLELIDGYIHYTYTSNVGPQVFTFDSTRVDDGEWHYFEARWLANGELVMALDYGQREQREKIASSISQKSVLDVYVGTLKLGSSNPENGYVGCISNVRVGNTQNSVLMRPEVTNAVDGCSSRDHCSSIPCSYPAVCVNGWDSYSCECPPGTMGPRCENICTTYNPCQNLATCHHPQGGSYECVCGRLQSGPYCEEVAQQPCPPKWWGNPVCGPCHKNCTRENGFNPYCNKQTGECSCLTNYYRPAGSYKCLPCDCYLHGSTSLQCDATIGHCPCIPGVMGKRCDQCPSRYAEIRLDEEDEIYGCKVDYAACPRFYSHGMWWDSEVMGVAVVQDCPDHAEGEAVRNCNVEGLWEEPNMFNCTSRHFLDLQKQIEKIERGQLKINKFVAKTTMAVLANATSHTSAMFGNDVNITLRIMNRMLDYENQQSGLNLTSEQEAKYLPNIMLVLSDIFQSQYAGVWAQINQGGAGTAGLVHKLERYLSTLAAAMELTSQQSPRPYSVVTDNIVLGVDTLNKQNFSGKNIPKYDNIVKQAMFDDNTNVYLPKSSLSEPPLKDFLQPSINAAPKAYVGYILYRHLGNLLPKSYSSSIRVISDRPMAVNSPVFSLLVRDDGAPVTGTLDDPVVFTFRQQMTRNRTSPQCVYWHGNNISGEWSTYGCKEVDRYELRGDMFIKCACSHMSSFAILMDVSDTEYIEAEPIQMEVITFICLIICMGCLFASFIVLCFFKRIQCNQTSIHINLIFVIFVAELAFLAGVNKPETEKWCRLVAITLHYFYMAGFSWLFVDILHIYRMLTEVRNIDTGTMKFYYLIAYVVPGIIVSLAVGLNAEGYGNRSFCWLSTAEKFIWSFAGPIAVAIVVNIFTFVMAVRATCREKISVADLSPLRVGLFANVMVLLLWSVVWVVGLLAVNYTYPALHYLYALFVLALGVFIFLVYILANSKVRFEMKKMWYRLQGRKLDLDDNIGGTRSSLYSRSALAYRRDSTDGGLARVNVGISTTSTTSRSTSKSSGGMYKGEDYLRSTSTDTSGNTLPLKYSNNGGLPPSYHDLDKADGQHDPDSIQIRTNPGGNDSDSDSEMSVGNTSLDLASSHSSDDDDDIGLNWETQLPKNKKIECRKLKHYFGNLGAREEAKEQARLQKLKSEQQQQQQIPLPPIPQLPQQQQYHQMGGQPQGLPSQPYHPQMGGQPQGLPSQPYHPQMGGQPQGLPSQPYHPQMSPRLQQKLSGTPPISYTPPTHHGPYHWPGDPQLSGYTGSDSEFLGSDQPTLSSMQPDVTLQTPEYKGRDFIISAPRRVDGVMNDSHGSPGSRKGPYSSPFSSPPTPRVNYSPREQLQNYSPHEQLHTPVERMPSPQEHTTVKVLTHRGSVSSECSHETCV